MITAIENKLKSFLTQENAKLAAPSIKIQAYYKGIKKIDMLYGQEYKFYDLASLTKIIFTTTRLMFLKQDKIFDETKHLNKFTNFDLDFGSDKLLTHSAGFKSSKQFYKKINPVNRAYNWTQIKKLISSEKAIKRGILYSDIGFLILMDVLENLDNTDIYSSWLKVKNELNLNDIDFNLKNMILKNSAPSGMCAWRGRVIEGVVNDCNTYVLDGVSTHAGLFGSIDAVSAWMLAIRASFFGDGCIDKSILHFFTKRHLGDWGLGFMKPNLDGSSSSGKYLTEDAFGHLGFTGTSVWFDPKLDIGIVILSNRLNAKTRTLFASLRPKIHDKIVELIKA